MGLFGTSIKDPRLKAAEAALIEAQKSLNREKELFDELRSREQRTVNTPTGSEVERGVPSDATMTGHSQRTKEIYRRVREEVLRSLE